MNVVPRTYHDRISLYPVQQIPRTTAPPGRLRRKGLRPQPERPPRPGGGTAGSRAATRGVTANGRRSHPPSGHPVFRGCAVRNHGRSQRRKRQLESWSNRKMNHPANNHFTATQIARALGVKRQAAQRLLSGIAPSGQVVANGRLVSAWLISALPAHSQELLASRAQSTGYRNAEQLLSAPDKQ